MPSFTQYAILSLCVACAAAPQRVGAQVEPTPLVEKADAIAFRTLEDATAHAAAGDRVLAVYFTATWCGWCRTMEASTFKNAGVVRAAHALSWAKVDIDERPDIAAMCGVAGVPALVFFNARGEFLGRRDGYIEPSIMLDVLAEYRDKGNAPGVAAQRQDAVAQLGQAIRGAATDEAMRAAITRALELMSDPQQRARREALQHSIRAAGVRAWPALVEALADERLRMRAAAADMWRATAPEAPDFDPFAGLAERNVQLLAARQWLTEP